MVVRVRHVTMPREGRESFSAIAGWKQLELFEREAKVLESLTHPGIPQ